MYGMFMTETSDPATTTLGFEAQSVEHGSTRESNVRTKGMTTNIHVIICVTLVVVMTVMGTFGNSLVILAVRRSADLKRSLGGLVVNLSVCDLVMTCLVLPVYIYTYTYQGWFLNTLLCTAVGFIAHSLLGTILVTISLIAWSRYRLIRSPTTNPSATTPYLPWLLASAWVLPAGFFVAVILSGTGRFGYNPEFASCTLATSTALIRVLILVVRALLPCILVAYFYTSIYCTAHAKNKHIYQNMPVGSSILTHAQKREAHLTKVMCAIFGIFVVSYWPCALAGVHHTGLSMEFHMYCQLTVHLGSAVNPLVYGVMNRKFRQAYKDLVKCGKYEKPVKATVAWAS